MPSKPPAKPKSPYAGLNYPKGKAASTAAVPALAEFIMVRCSVGPMTALPAACLIDQGDVESALDLLHAEIARLAAERAEREAAAKARAGRHP